MTRAETSPRALRLLVVLFALFTLLWLLAELVGQNPADPLAEAWLNLVDAIRNPPFSLTEVVLLPVFLLTSKIGPYAVIYISILVFHQKPTWAVPGVGFVEHFILGSALGAVFFQLREVSPESEPASWDDLKRVCVGFWRWEGLEPAVQPTAEAAATTSGFR